MIKFAKAFVRLMALAVLFFDFGNAANAQISDSLRAEMRKISDELFHTGNFHYFEIDAICDGYLPLDTKFKIVSEYGRAMLNDQLIPLEYIAKQQRFNMENYRKSSLDFFVSSDGISLKAVFDPKSYLRMDHHDLMTQVSSGYSGNAEKYDSKKIILHLISMMVADGLVDTANYFDLHFDHNKMLTVNDNRIDDKYASKYAMALKDDGYDIVETIGSIRYNNNYRKHW